MPAEIFPEYILIRVNEFDKVSLTPLEEWMKYLKDGTICPDTSAPGLSEAREKLKYYSMSPKERMAYDEHLNAMMIQNDVLDSAKLEGRLEGIVEGKAEGKAERSIEIAQNLKHINIPVEQIANVTGLSIEELQRI